MISDKFNQDQTILLDVIMPKKNGREVFEAARALKPGIKVLFTSGYTGDILHEKGFGDESLNFISKPASPYKLLMKIREILDKA